MRSVLVALAAVLLGFVEAQASTPVVKPAKHLAVSIYGSASFIEGLSVGSHAHNPSPGSAGLALAGDRAELALHDRGAASYSQHTRWALYSSGGRLRSHRTGNSGGLILEHRSTQILKDLNVAGKVISKDLVLEGAQSEGESVLIGDRAAKHLKFGYEKGYSWIQSGRAHLSVNPLKNDVCIGTMIPKKKLTVGSGHMRVDNKLYVGKGFVSGSELKFGLGAGWQTAQKSMSTTGEAAVFTDGAGEIAGNVGIGIRPKFPTFRLQVHGGDLMVTGAADSGLMLSQSKEAAVLRAWNADAKKHERLLIQGAPVILQPRDGPVLFGTDVPKKDMKIHIHGNLYIHGDMHSLQNLHVRDHAVLKHLVMPSLSLKGEPQTPDGDTLVLGHMTRSAAGASSGPQAPKTLVVHGTNLRFGFHSDYAWIQVHGKADGDYKPLALNPLGNVVSIGSTTPDKKFNLYAKGNGYVLGTLFVKSPTANVAQGEVTRLAHESALKALNKTKVQQVVAPTTSNSTAMPGNHSMFESTLDLLSVPDSLKSETGHASIRRLTEMYASVLSQQELQMSKQAQILKIQATKISLLRKHFGM